MSIPFSNTTNKNGIIQRIERELGFNDGGISGNTTLMAQFTANVNLSLDDAQAIILPASGTWKFDDSNYDNTTGGYPVVATNLVSSQRDYQFTTDSFGNYILDIYKVFVANSNGIFSEIYPVDVETDSNSLNTVSPSGSLNTQGLSTFTDGRNTTGTPTQYDKQANAIFLDPIPSYDYSNGLKVYINREASYFTVNDTTKKPGFAGLFHEYCVVNPAYKYAFAKNMKIAQGLAIRKQALERGMSDYYGRRPRDERRRLVPNIESCE